MCSKKPRNEINPKEPEPINFPGSKYRCEDILSCISALDEVIAEFDDPSLPYINEDELPTPLSVSPIFVKSQTSTFTVSQPEKAEESPHLSSERDSAATNLQNHLIESPMICKPTPKGRSKTYLETTVVLDPKAVSRTSSGTSGKLPGSSSVKSSSERDPSSPKVTSNSSSPVGGTYSKGYQSQQYEVLLPRIPSADNSSRASAPEPIYSCIGKSRPQLTLGMFTSEIHQEVKGDFAYPQDPEVDYNEDGLHDDYDDTLSGLSHSSKRSTESNEKSSADSEGKPVKNFSSGKTELKEQWNFPSEKNLPRSLRKTRKTCFSEEGAEDNGKLSNDSSFSSSLNREGASPFGCSLGRASSSSSSSSRGASKGLEEMNQNNSFRDDNHKIYEEISVLQQSPSRKEKANPDHHSSRAKDELVNKQPNSTALSYFNQPTGNHGHHHPSEKSGRMRQRIPDECSPPHIKYPPGKGPKPNPKPGIVRNEEFPQSASPSSPALREISRNEEIDSSEIDVEDRKLLKSDSTEDNKSVDSDILKDDNSNKNSSSVKNLNNGSSGSAGNMMRMMMMMKQSAKTNSTGSASSISRSSSSSSGGGSDQRKDHTLSSSSGVVVTSSSTTSASPTHAMNNQNNNNNNNITIISTEKSAREQAIIALKGDQRRIRIACQSTPQNKTASIQGSGLLDVDDGYLSMINRNEAPLLWPEEFIENETFSPDELKRLSVHLPEETSPDEDSDCSAEGKEIELQIVDYDTEPSRRRPTQGLPGKSSRKKAWTEKTDYFSDDSLELEGDSEEQDTSSGSIGKLRANSVSPYLSQKRIPQGVKGSGTDMASFIPMNNPGNHNPYHTKISVNQTAVSYHSKGQQLSRIPKIVSGRGSQGKKGGRVSIERSDPVTSQLHQEPVVVVMRKPCSFFISLSDTTSEVMTSAEGKCSSLPKGSRVAISPTKKLDIKDSKIIQSEKQLSPNLNAAVFHLTQGNSTDTKTNIVDASSPTKSTNLSLATNNIPNLRHTKSINICGPRVASSSNHNNASKNKNSNATKRKSTSDLITVVALNPDTESKDLKTSAQGQSSSTFVTSNFNRNTFLIPPPLSRPVEPQLSPKTVQKDVNKSQLLSSSSDTRITSLSNDALQPLTLENVHEFVSEIMDTAVRQGLKRLSEINPDNLTITTTIPSLSQASVIIMPIQESTNPVTVKSGQEDASEVPFIPTQVDEQFKYEGNEGSLKWLRRDYVDADGNDPQVASSQEKKEVDVGHLSGDAMGDTENTTVSKELELVLTTCLSHNQLHGSFQLQTHSNETDPTMTGHGEQSLEWTMDCLKTESGRVSPRVHSLLVNGSTHSDNSIPRENPLMSSTPINKPNSNNVTLRDSSLVGEEKILDDSGEEDSEELPPSFIPNPPPAIVTPVINPISMAPMVQNGTPFVGSLKKDSVLSEARRRFGNGPSNIHPHHPIHNHHSSNIQEGKAALDLLAERISSKKSSSPEDFLNVSQFIHDKRNIWAMYDRPFDEDMLTATSTGRGYASRSQENLMDAMCKERFQKTFSIRGQSSTLPLNCRPPAAQRRSSTFRNMINKFRRSKQSDAMIKDIPEYRDDEVQSITSRETGPSEQGTKKRGFFRRLFRRSRKT